MSVKVKGVEYECSGCNRPDALCRVMQLFVTETPWTNARITKATSPAIPPLRAALSLWKCLIMRDIWRGCLLPLKVFSISFSVNLCFCPSPSPRLISASSYLRDPSPTQTPHKASDAARPLRTFLSMKASAGNVAYFPSSMHVWAVACWSEAFADEFGCSETVFYYQASWIMWPSSLVLHMEANPSQASSTSLSTTTR